MLELEFLDIGVGTHLADERDDPAGFGMGGGEQRHRRPGGQFAVQDADIDGQLSPR